VTNIRFEWDETKNRSNQRKHGLSFEEAIRVFLDPLRISSLEQIESGEERWQTFGIVRGTLLLMVVHTTWEETDEETWIEVQRIISARPATSHERRKYENENG
jgi:uncharacterized protein